MEETAQAVPKCPNGLFNFSLDAHRVQDADEEILELYMNLASTDDRDTSNIGGMGGLGFLDSSQSILDLELVLTRPAISSSSGSPLIELSDVSHTRKTQASGKRNGEKNSKAKEKEIRLGVKVQQDLSALKGRKGDTGSVLWRSSLHLARHVSTQHHFPPSFPLLDPERLRSARVLELGAGTGLLALLLAPLCREYTASDRLENLKLVHRNLELNAVAAAGKGSVEEIILPKAPKGKHVSGKKSKVSTDEQEGHQVLLEEIDWVEVSTDRVRQEARSPILSPASAPASMSPTSSRSYGRDENGGMKPGYELILAVDCIYNENLVKPLVDTLAKYCPPGGKTVVWVVVELRSSDVLTLFLDTWLNDDERWTIVRLGPEAMGSWDGGTRPRWVGWVGWR